MPPVTFFTSVKPHSDTRYCTKGRGGGGDPAISPQAQGLMLVSLGAWRVEGRRLRGPACITNEAGSNAWSASWRTGSSSRVPLALILTL